MSEFAEKVYTITRKIPKGKVATYGQIAELLGGPILSRAVGNALHHNPDGDATPCYRVVNGAGKLAPGFVFGGNEEQKRRLEADGIKVRQVGEEYYVNLSDCKWDGKIAYYSLNHYLRDTYGRKLYKVSLDAGFTCPNRDGKIGTGGCIFCSAGGSGDFAQNRTLSITEQIEAGKRLVEGKMRGSHKEECIKTRERDHLPSYIAYFQAFTNTYAPLETLREKYTEALRHPDIAIVSIATRPDCISEEIVELLCELRKTYGKPIWVELGLQTIHRDTAEYIRRGYPLSTYARAMKYLNNKKIPVITHVILGLPGEVERDMLETVSYVGRSGSFGIKLQLLHVLQGTDLAIDYENGEVELLSMEDYVELVAKCIAILPENMVIHRMTGDGDKKLLLAPLWSGDKKRVLNALHTRLTERF